MRTSFLSLVKRFAREERGASLVEYAILVAMITGILVAAITALGDGIGAQFTAILGVIQNNVPGT
jgi:pilus assembly protein Flp/PilA